MGGSARSTVTTPVSALVRGRNVTAAVTAAVVAAPSQHLALVESGDLDGLQLKPVTRRLCKQLLAAVQVPGVAARVAAPAAPRRG